MGQSLAHREPRSSLDQINDALHTSVIDVLRTLIPSLRAYTNDEAFNVIMNSPEMAARSFRAFRENPQAFSDLLVDAADQPVTNDNEPLSCGRSLAQVVSLVVQAVAKRYFRAKLGLKRKKAPPKTATTTPLLLKIVTFFKGQKAVAKAKRPLDSSDRLYFALRDYLLYEWQLRLIPHYVGLSIALVQSLGPRILDYREIDDIQWMVKTGRAPVAPSVKSAALVAVEEMITQKPAVKVSEMAPPPETTPAPIPENKLVAPPGGIERQQYVAAILGRVNPLLAKKLLKELGVPAAELATIMVRVYEALPASEFQRLGASPPNSFAANRFISAMLQSEICRDGSDATMKEFARIYAVNIGASL